MKKTGYFTISFFITLFLFVQLFECSLYAARKRPEKVELIKFNIEKKRGNTRSIVQGVSSTTKMKDLWGIISCVYNTTEDWLDKVKIKYSVLLFKGVKKRDKRKPMKFEDRYSLLVGDVVYLNVAEGKNHQSRMFIHPNTLKRYGEIKEIKIEAILDGKVISSVKESFASRKEKLFVKDWTTKYTPKFKQGLMRSNVTPFIYDGDNSLEQIEK